MRNKIAGYTSHLMKKLRKVQSEESHSSFKKRKERERWISSQRSLPSKSATSISRRIPQSKNSSTSLESTTSSRPTRELIRSETTKRKLEQHDLPKIKHLEIYFF